MVLGVKKATTTPLKIRSPVNPGFASPTKPVNSPTKHEEQTNEVEIEEVTSEQESKSLKENASQGPIMRDEPLKKSDKLADEEFVEEILEELKKKQKEFKEFAEKALEKINGLEYCANELKGHIEYLERKEKLRLTTFFLKTNVLLGSFAEEDKCKNKSAEELANLINAKLKELEKKLSPQHQEDILNTREKKVETQTHKTNDSQLISKVDKNTDYSQLVDIQSQTLSEGKTKQVDKERKLNFALITLAFFVLSSIGLLGVVMVKMKKSGKAREKIKK